MRPTPLVLEPLYPAERPAVGTGGNRRSISMRPLAPQEAVPAWVSVLAIVGLIVLGYLLATL